MRRNRKRKEREGEGGEGWKNIKGQRNKEKLENKAWKVGKI